MKKRPARVPTHPPKPERARTDPLAVARADLQRLQAEVVQLREANRRLADERDELQRAVAALPPPEPAA